MGQAELATAPPRIWKKTHCIALPFLHVICTDKYGENVIDLVGLLRREELAAGGGHGVESLRKLADAVRKALTSELLQDI